MGKIVKTMSKRNRALGGFTLIELMISIVILVVGLVGVLLIIPLGQRTTGKSALASRAAILATEKIEELKSKGYDNLISQPVWSGAEDEFTWEALTAAVTLDDFQGVVTIPNERLIKITMEVSYSSQGKNKTDTFVTFYSEL